MVVSEAAAPAATDWLSPALTTIFDGGPGTTSTVAVPDFPSDVAVIVTVPGVFALATPVAASIDKTAGLELLHETGRVSVVPSLSFSVAASCLVVTTAIGERSPPTVTVSTFGSIITA